MRAAQRFQSVAKLLYTQNPFYLISCGLIFYGIHLAVPASSSLVSRSLILIGSMAAYTLLMSLTAVCVIRWGKVWDDARSILLILLIAILGMSASFDELCVTHWKLAAIVAAACFAFSATIVEGVLLFTRIRFSLWYRVPLYAILAVFFAGPVVAGYAVAEEIPVLTRWAAPAFSSLIAIALMTMAPALRRGASYVAKNGTPWSWPMFPLAPFAVLIVLAIIRSHGIWMSFSSTTGSISFEPFLLAPILLAAAFLAVESDREKSRDLSIGAMIWLPVLLAPTLWLGGSHGAVTALPIQAELTSIFGSTFTLGIIGLIAFYGYAWWKHVPGAAYFLALAILGSAFLSIPALNRLPHFHPWMLAAGAAAILLFKSVRQPTWELSWAAFVVVLAIAVKLFADQWRLPLVSYTTAGMVGFAGALVIGAAFRTPFGSFLRTAAAGVSCVVALGGLFLQLRGGNSFLYVGAILAMSLIPVIYLFVVRRRWWIAVAGINSLCAIAGLLLIAGNHWQPALFDARRWVIPIGFGCFVVASGISFLKTGAHRRFFALLRRYNSFGRFEAGF